MSTQERGTPVNHPNHYNVGKIEVIDAIDVALSVVLAISSIIGLIIIEQTRKQPQRYEVITDGESYGFINWVDKVESGFKTRAAAAAAAADNKAYSDDWDRKSAINKAKRDTSRWVKVPKLPEDRVLEQAPIHGINITNEAPRPPWPRQVDSASHTNYSPNTDEITRQMAVDLKRLADAVQEYVKDHKPEPKLPGYWFNTPWFNTNYYPCIITTNDLVFTNRVFQGGGLFVTNKDLLIDSHELWVSNVTIKYTPAPAGSLFDTKWKHK